MNGNILLIVSCVDPVTKINLKKTDVKNRYKETLLALQYYYSRRNEFSKLHFIDCSLSSEYLEKLQKIFPEVEFYWYFPSWVDLDKGKGFSEYSLMISHYDSILKKLDFTGIVKVSARYRISNVDFFNRSFEGVFSAKSFILKSSCSTIFYSHRLVMTQLLELLSSVDDNLGYYFEHALYKVNPQKRSFVYPKYLPGTTSATTGRNYKGLRHILRKIIYRFF